MHIFVMHGLLLVAVWSVVGTAETPLEAELSRGSYAARAVGCHVRCLSTGVDIVRHNADTPYIPASVAKLVTAATAYELLGQSYTFSTDVYVDGALDCETGHVDGNLYIRGGGDPGLVAERCWLFVQRLRNLGIRGVRGDCILDDSFFDTVTSGPGFTNRRSSKPYEALTGALSAHFNSIEILSRPGQESGSPVRVSVFPWGSDQNLHVSARTVGPGESRYGIRARTEPSDQGTKVVVRGSLGLGAQPHCAYRKVWETTEHFGRVQAALFAESGIRVHGSFRRGTVPDSVADAGPFYVFEGLPLRRYVEYLFKYSSNVTAEMVFKTFAAESNGRRGGSWDEAAKIVRQWWSGRGLPGELHLENGSGMGTHGRLTPCQIVELLAYVHSRKSYYPDYCAALPVGGGDGTLADRFTRSSLKGYVRAKTGTLVGSGVSSLAGYLFHGGRTYAFAILINDTEHGQFEHWVLQERILEAVLPQ